MKRRVIKLLVIGLVILAAGRFVFRTNDITKDVLRVENSILDVLKDFGVSNKNIISRTETKWTESRLRAETVSYVFSLDKTAPASRILKDVETNLANFKKFHLPESLFCFDKNTAVMDFKVFYRDRPVLKIRVNNVLPDWMEDTGEEVFEDPPQEVSKRQESIKRAPAVKNDAVIALVLDDFGYTKKNLRELKNLKTPITLAVLPNAPYTETVCSFAKENGFETIIHLPMEPEKKTESLEKDTITCDMTGAEIKKNVTASFKSVPSAKGMSNHMGSKATGNERLMTTVFTLLKNKNMFFLDSFTTEKSVSGSVAEETGVICAKRDIFIDNKSDKEYILAQMDKLKAMAFSKGYVIAIGHDRSLTVKVLKETVPIMKKEGVKFVLLSEMISLEKKYPNGNNS